MATSTTPRLLRASCLEQRRDRVRAKMQEAGIELLIAYGTGNHSFQAMNPAWYITGFKQMGRHMALLLPQSGDLTLVMSPTWDAARARERATSVANVIATDDERFLDTVGQQLQAQNLKSKRTAIAGGSGQPRAIRDAWESILGQAPENADQMVTDVAKIRDEWSLHCVRQACEIAEAGYARLREFAHVGMYEHELAAELENSMHELGSEDNFQMICTSQHNGAVHNPTYRVIDRGDVMLGEITPSVDGEFVQICRTAVFGKPSDLLVEKFNLLDGALHDGLKFAKAGTWVADVVDVINKPIVAAGYEKYAQMPYIRTRGHSMGLGSMEPDLASDRAHQLENDMVFVMHPNQYIPETGYLMCGEPVIITDNGAVPLTKTMGHLDVIE